MSNDQLPRGSAFHTYAAPIVETLKEMGGSGSPADVTERVIGRLGLSDETLGATTSNGQSRVRNQIGWARFYLVQAGCLDGSQRGVWALTERGRGAPLDPATVAALFASVGTQFKSARSADEDDENAPALESISEAISHWRKDLDRAQSDPSWSEMLGTLESRRRQAAGEMCEMLERFLAGNDDTERFRTELDQRGRTDRSTFGVGALLGGMFLNKLVKHVADEATLAHELRNVLRAPRDTADAASRLKHFAAYLQGLIETGAVTKAAVQPARAVFFVSACWHMQVGDVWPTYLESARDALANRGHFEETNDRIADYFLFRKLVSALEIALHLSTWQLEQLIEWVQEHPERPPAPASDAAPALDEGRRRVWLIAPGESARLWEDFKSHGIAAIGWDGLGDLSKYPTRQAMRARLAEGRTTVPRHDALACWEFAREMKVGDVVFAKRGRSHIVGYGIVESDYRYVPSRVEYHHVRTVRWIAVGSWRVRDKPLVTKTLTDIGRYPQLVEQIRELLGIEEAPVAGGEVAVEVGYPEYTALDACKDLFMSRTEIERIVALLRHKKNVVLQGPPGVGKTFVAKRLAYLLLGERDPARVHIVQFHQSYGYEDFVRGFRPTEEGGFVRKDGPFLRLCNHALQNLDDDYVMIIDEINRGNLGKILGDLMMLIEPDKRDESWASQISYSSDQEPPFYVPPNVHLIGTMNTADRSLALVDYALRRRFAFVAVEPGFESAAFSTHLGAIGVAPTLSDRIRRRVGRLNDVIRKDRQLGEGFCIGHSYFCAPPSGQVPGEIWFLQVIQTEIEPLLREYWFDASDRADEALGVLREDG